MLDENFYTSLKKFFKTQGITQQRVADELGTSQAYINQLLSGKSPFGKQMANRFQALYGLNAAWLLTGEGEMLSAPNGGSVNHISIDAGGIHASGGSSVSNVRQGTASDATTVDKLIGVMTRQQEQMSHQQEQIDQLIQILKDKL